MFLTLTLAANDCHDNNAPESHQRERAHSGDNKLTGGDWLEDQSLNPKERVQCRDIATPRTGWDRRRIWPADELHGVLEGGEP
jgi:hypothetical protein